MDSMTFHIIGRTAVGTVIWFFVAGYVHVYFLCVQGPIPGTSTRPFIALLIAGVAIGLSAEAIFLIAAAVRSGNLLIFGPLIAGILIGAAQGFLVGTNWWGLVQ